MTKPWDEVTEEDCKNYLMKYSNILQEGTFEKIKLIHWQMLYAVVRKITILKQIEEAKK